MDDRISALESLMDEAPNVYQKIDAMNELAWEIKDNNPQKGEILSQDALALSKRGEENGQPYQKGIADSLRNLAVVNQRLSNYQFALTCALEARDLYQSLDRPEGEGQALRIMGAVYDHLGDYPEALDYCLQSIAINEEIGNEKGLARALGNLGVTYNHTGEFYKELDAYEKALKIYKKTKDPSGQAIIYNNMAMAYYSLEEYDKALMNSKKSLSLSKENDITMIMVNTVCTIGEIYLEKGDKKSAQEYFQESLTLSKETEYKFIELHSLFNLGKICYLYADNETARDYLQQALSIADEIKEKQVIFECHKLLSEINKKIGDFETALSHLEKYIQVQAEIFNQEAEAKILNLEILHQAKIDQREKESKKASESQFQILFEESPISIWEFDWSQLKKHIDGLKKSGVADFDAYFQEHPEEVFAWVDLVEVVNVNAKTVELLKAKGKEVFLTDFNTFIHKDAVDLFQSFLAKFAVGEKMVEVRVPTFTFEGDEIYTEVIFSIAQGYEDSWSKILCSVIDVTEREVAKQTLKESEELYRTVSEMANDGISIMDGGMFTYCNPSLARILGREIDEVLSLPFPVFIHPDSLPDIQENYMRAMSGETVNARWEFKVIKKDGSVVTVEVNASAMDNTSSPRLLMITRDITEQKRLEDELHILATTDPLTGISNRRHFFELAGQELERSQRYEHQLGLIMLDIDYFKKINDSYGHVVGDEVLKQLAQTWKNDLRSNDLIARFGGEEFVVLLQETDKEDVESIAERIRKKLSSKTFNIEGNKFKMTVSLGIACLNPKDESTTIDQLIEEADKALYQSKQSGRDQVMVWKNQSMVG